jgi:hypothetical protein
MTKIKPFVEKLGASPTYKDFSDKYKDAFMIAGFFIIDYETGKNIHQIDYYVPSENKIAAFNLDNHVTVQLLDTMGKAKIKPEKLDFQSNVDLDALHGILEDEMKNRNITEEIKKIIAVISMVDGKKIWNVNCLLSGMGILKAHVDDDSQTILKMEKSNIMDYVKRMPGAQLAAMKKAAGAGAKPVNEEGEAEEGEAEAGEESEGELKAKIKKLGELEKELEKEKDEAETELKKEVSKTKSPKKAREVKAQSSKK